MAYNALYQRCSRLAARESPASHVRPERQLRAPSPAAPQEALGVRREAGGVSAAGVGIGDDRHDERTVGRDGDDALMQLKLPSR